MSRHRAEPAPPTAESVPPPADLAAPTDEPAPDELTARTRIIRVIPVTVALAIVAVGLALAVMDHWRKGSAALALAAAVAAVLRLLLPARFAGVLAVRSRLFDVIFLLAVTALLGAMALAVVVPDR